MASEILANTSWDSPTLNCGNLWIPAGHPGPFFSVDPETPRHRRSVGYQDAPWLHVEEHSPGNLIEFYHGVRGVYRYTQFLKNWKHYTIGFFRSRTSLFFVIGNFHMKCRGELVEVLVQRSSFSHFFAWIRSPEKAWQSIMFDCWTLCNEDGCMEEKEFLWKSILMWIFRHVRYLYVRSWPRPVTVLKGPHLFPHAKALLWFDVLSSNAYAIGGVPKKCRWHATLNVPRSFPNLKAELFWEANALGSSGYAAWRVMKRKAAGNDTLGGGCIFCKFSSVFGEDSQFY